jgi:hypothetical protein
VFKKAILCFLGLAVLVCAFTFLHVFYISDGGNGTLLWNGDTAYVFLDLGSLGYRLSYLQYIGQIAKEILGVGREPSDERYSNVVFTINSGNVHRYVLNDMRLSGYYVINGRILSGDTNTGILWKWNVNYFERATAQYQRDLTKAGESRLTGPEYDDIDGWHQRISIFSHNMEPYTYVMNLSGATLSLRTRQERLDDLSVDLVRSDGSTETIWHVDGHPKKVSRTDYEEAFNKH